MSRVVLANGCFDPCHPGHVLHLKAARAMGDELVIALTSDEAMDRERGSGRRLFDQVMRRTLLEELRCVKWVQVVDSALQGLQLIKPDIFVKGSDYIGRIAKVDEAFCKERGIKIAFTRDRKWSATDVVRELRAR